MIDGVILEDLVAHPDERGRVMELDRSDAEGFPGFGQATLVTLFPGVIKAWHRHHDRTDTFVCARGTVRVGLYDGRDGSETAEELNQFYLAESSPKRLRVPPGVWFGLKAVGAEEAFVLVVSDEPHDSRDPDEERIDPHINEIPFDWERRDR
jgi:dTDP-4-dehydrorhamnose 3,5-epimerase